jgi:methylthioribulose-1-phosphate dehydratase
LTKKSLAKVGKFFAKQGWSPATSSNYSVRLDQENMLITRSGVDKYRIEEEDIIVADLNGQPIEPADAKPSAETLIHTCIYRERPNAKSVLHTHSVLGTRLSLKFQTEGQILISGYELLKGLAGNKTHEMTEKLPILPNDQDMQRFSQSLTPLLQKETEIHGFLIAGHGLYTWGQDLDEAKRHIETYEFLFQCLEKEIRGI